MATRGWRINLRALAEVQTLAWTPIFLLFAWAGWHLLLVFWAVLTEPHDDNDTALVPAHVPQASHMHRHGHGTPIRQHTSVQELV